MLCSKGIRFDNHFVALPSGKGDNLVCETLFSLRWWLTSATVRTSFTFERKQSTNSDVGRVSTYRDVIVRGYSLSPLKKHSCNVLFSSSLDLPSVIGKELEMT